jgi:hypothetical protein
MVNCADPSVIQRDDRRYSSGFPSTEEFTAKVTSATTRSSYFAIKQMTKPGIFLSRSTCSRGHLKAGRACAARGTCSSPEPRIAACRPVGGRDHGTEAPAFPRRRVRTTTCDWSDPQAPHSCGERSRGCDRQRPAVRQSRDARRRRRWWRMSTSSELRFVMKSGATPAPTPRSRRCLRTRLTRDGQQALRRCRSQVADGGGLSPVG